MMIANTNVDPNKHFKYDKPDSEPLSRTWEACPLWNLKRKMRQQSLFYAFKFDL